MCQFSSCGMRSSCLCYLEHWSEIHLSSNFLQQQVALITLQPSKSSEVTHWLGPSKCLELANCPVSWLLLLWSTTLIQIWTPNSFSTGWLIIFYGMKVIKKLFGTALKEHKFVLLIDWFLKVCIILKCICHKCAYIWKCFFSSLCSFLCLKLILCTFTKSKKISQHLKTFETAATVPHRSFGLPWRPSDKIMCF